MTSVEVAPEVLARRPKRADARRNYEALLAAAGEAFAADGTSASLEDIARSAQVGIGTLYRHFPTRQDLFEGVYVNEVEKMCQSAEDVADLPPWDALVTWLHRFVAYAATKRAIAEQLTADGSDSQIFAACRGAINGAGTPLLERAQQSGDARLDVSFDDVLRLVAGITMMTFAEPGQLERVLGMAFDGLRAR